MKKMKKIIAVVAAASMVLTSCITASARTVIGGVQYTDALVNNNTEVNITSGIRHSLVSTPDAYYKVEAAGNGYAQVRPTMHCHGAKCILLNANGDSDSHYVKMHFVFNKQAPDNEYHISFNARYNGGNYRTWRDYATLNQYNWDSTAQLTNASSIWTATDVTDSNDTNTWRHYEAVITQQNNTPELHFGVYNFGQMGLDDILVKDKNGNILYSEDFEGSSRLATCNTDNRLSTTMGQPLNATDKYYYIEKTGDAYAKVSAGRQTHDGTKGLFVFANGGNIRVHFAFNEQAPDNEYHISFDLANEASDSIYATKNIYQLDGWTGNANLNATNTIWTKTFIKDVDAGEIDHWYHYETVITNQDTVPELNFGTQYWGKFRVDNILVKDKNGNTLYSEDFDGDEGMIESLWSYTKASGTKPATFAIAEETGNSGNHVMKIKGYNAGMGLYYVDLPLVKNNTYIVTFEKKNVKDPTVGFGFSNNVWDEGTLNYNIGWGTGVVTKTINSQGNNRFRISAEGYAEAELDNFVIKDVDGNVVFRDNFDGNEDPVAYKGGWTKEGSAHTIKISESSGNHRLQLLGDGSGSIAKYKIALPEKATGNEYHITYDYEKTSTGAGLDVSLDLNGTDIYGAGQINKVTNSEHIVTGSGDYLIFALTGWAGVFVDNIVVKDKNGKVLFTEDFEDYDKKYNYTIDERILQGLSANGDAEYIYLSWRNPARDDIREIQIFENNEETFESQFYAYDMNTESNYVNIVPMEPEDTEVHEYDVRMITTSGTVYHNYVSGKKGAKFIDATVDKNGTPLQGWRLVAQDGEIAALGCVEYDELNKWEGEHSLHINPNITYTSYEQENDSDKTHVMADYNDGARFILETTVYGVEAGQAYNLNWKQMANHAPHYYAQLVVDNNIQQIGSVTGQNGYVPCTGWQDRSITFTPETVATDGSVNLRFEFSNGCDDFWLDDMELTAVGGTENLIANGSFEYGLENFKKTGISVTWDLADQNDLVNVYRLVGDTLIKLETLPKGTESYTIPEFDGTVETLVFKTVKKSSDKEFLSEAYTEDYTQSSHIYDAKLEIVKETENGYEVVGTPEKLTGNILLKASLKLENATDVSSLGADLYTMIYKDGALLKVDKQTATAGTQITANYGSIISVPSISDGQYTAKVFVWNIGTMEAIKDAKVLGE